jgi:hypothetical protein
MVAGGGFAYYLRDIYMREESEREYAAFLPERIQENEGEEGENAENPDGEENAVGEVTNESGEAVQTEQEITPDLSEPISQSLELPKPPENVPQYDPQEIISEMTRSNDQEVELIPSDSNENATSEATLETNDNLKNFFPDDVETIDQIMENLSPDSEEGNLEVENRNNGDKVLSDLAAEMLGNDFPIEKLLNNEPINNEPTNVEAHCNEYQEEPITPSDETPEENPNFAGFVGLPAQASIEEPLNIFAQLTNDMIITTSTIQEIPKESITATYSLPLITTRKKGKK